MTSFDPKLIDPHEALVTLSKYPIVECSCDECKKLCQRMPCIGTINDIRTLIDNEYADKLTLNFFKSWEYTEWDVYFPSPAMRGFECKLAPFIRWKPMECVFYNNGCEIHDIKPTEGKLVDHTELTEDLYEIIVSTWNCSEGIDLTEEWKEMVGYQEEIK